MNENKYKKGVSTLDKCQPHQRGQIYFRVRNAVALISRCVHFVMTEMVEKSEKRRRGGGNMKFNFLPKVTIPKRIKADSLVKQ